MKNKLLLLLFISALILSFYSCKTGPSGEAYAIKMRLAKGDTFSHNIQMNMIMNMAVMETKMNMDMGVSFKVTNADSLQKELAMTYTKSHMSMDMGPLLKSVNTDSIMNKTTSKYVGKTVTLKLSKDNQITEIVGSENLLPDSSNADEAARQTVQKMFSKEQLNNLFGMMFSMYPKNPVKVGESWKGQTTVNMAGFDMKINITYKLASVKDGLANIDVTGIIDGKGEMNQKGMKMGMDISGDQKGSYTVKLADGYMDHASYKINVKGDMAIMGQKMPITMTGDCTMKGM